MCDQIRSIGTRLIAPKGRCLQQMKSATSSVGTDATQAEQEEEDDDADDDTTDAQLQSNAHSKSTLFEGPLSKAKAYIKSKEIFTFESI